MTTTVLIIGIGRKVIPSKVPKALAKFNAIRTSKAHKINRVWTFVEIKLSKAFEKLRDQGHIEPLDVSKFINGKERPKL